MKPPERLDDGPDAQRPRDVVSIGADLPPAPDPPLERRRAGREVRMVQEWLTLHGYETTVDGLFGPATERALSTFFADQKQASIPPRVTPRVWQALWAPMEYALRPLLTLEGPARQFRESAGDNAVPMLALRYAQEHLSAHVRELPQNRGPWVRLYMGNDPVNGYEGPDFPWCAGAVSFWIRQAVLTFATFLGWAIDRATLWPPAAAWSCDRIGAWAEDTALMTSDLDQVHPGAVFLIRRTPGDWVHTGLIESVDRDQKVIVTIEGNTNAAGAREGVEVRRRFRSVTGDRIDFIVNYGAFI